MGTCYSDNKEYQMTTKFYCCPCIIKRFEKPKQVGKWDNKLCLACEEIFLDEEIQAIKYLDGCPYDDDKIWQMALAKIKEASPEEIKIIKNNSPKLIELDWNPEPVINLLNPEQFHKYYQELAPTREE
ncbi:hypothetical protein G9A89_016388 [Geosiphon pyriformis]|nr:hypothetical protein G9A89_016388 [Geosiphon pyriformis]